MKSEVEIEGFAAPYGIPNTFNEILLPRSFRNLVRPIPMLLEHRPWNEVGHWHTVWEDAAGIWVRGVIRSPILLRDMERTKKAVPELSISFRPTMSAGQAINRFSRFNKGWPLVNVDEWMVERFTEVSLCHEGAYPNTSWRVVC